MKRLISLILMMTALAVPAAAQMNYELPSAHITYTHLGESAMPALIDVLGDGTAQQAEEPQADTWPKTFTVTVAGDTTLGSTDDLRKRDDCFEAVYAAQGAGWFFSGLTELFASDDLTLINFEGTLTEATQKKEKLYNFKGPAEYTDILTLGSVEAVNIANNHIVDYGDQGKEDTIANLEAAGLVVSGGGMLGIFEKNGVKVGMTGYCFPYQNEKKDISKDVAALR